MVFNNTYTTDEKKAATLSWTRTIDFLRKKRVNFNACYKSGTGLRFLWFNVNKILKN
jgi:hypothetical protein